MVDIQKGFGHSDQIPKLMEFTFPNCPCALYGHLS